MASGLTESLLPVIGTLDMLSTPPATTTSAEPKAMCCAACATACRPEAQKRLTVTPAVSIGRPPRSAAMRATFRPCSPSGIAQPRTTSSTSAGDRVGSLASAARITCPASSSGRVRARAPFPARPTALRTAAAITTSICDMVNASPARSVSERLVVHQHVLHSLLALRLTAQGQERLALELEHALLRDRGDRAVDAAAQNAGQLAGDLGVVRRRLPGLLQR